jgi:hypothetical protein
VWQAGPGGEQDAGEAGSGNQRRPPGQGASPNSQLGGAAAPILGAGGAAGVAQTASGLLGWEHRLGLGWCRLGSRRGSGRLERVAQSIQGGPAAAQRVGELVGLGVQEPLELFSGQGANRKAAALVDRRAQLLQVVWNALSWVASWDP